MGVLSRVGLFGAKCTCMGYCCYNFQNIGVWGDSSRSTQLYHELLIAYKPYINQIIGKLKNELPVQYQNQGLPKIDDFNRCVTVYWNKGVITSVDFLSCAPNYITSKINDGASYIMEEVAKM